MKRSILRTAGLGVGIVGLVVLLLYTIWMLEESGKGVRTVVIENPAGDDIFVVELPPEEERSDLIIQCVEEEFQDAFARFAKFLGVKAPPLTVPGGAMILAASPNNKVSETHQAAKRALVEVLKRHSPKRIILVAHSECLFYDVVAAWQNNLDEVKRRQEEDLRKARDLLQSWLPRTEVQIFYAQKDGNQLKFNHLPLAERKE